MADWAKKIEKFNENQLSAGESIVAAAFLQPLGVVSSAAITGGIGGLLGMFIGKKVHDSKVTKEDMIMNGKAKDLISGPTIVGVTTANRIVVYEQSVMSGKPKKFIQAFDKNDISHATFEKGKMAHKLTLTFSDGDVASYDYPRGQKTDEFMAAIGG